MLRVAIVGTGFGQKVHLPAFQAHHQTEVVAIYHRQLAKAEAIAQAYQVTQACSTVAEIVSLPDVDAVSISTPPFLHYEMAKTVLQAKKHLLLEKPTSLNVTEAIDLYQLAQAQGVVAMMNFEFPLIPAWQYLAELLATGYVGHKRLINVDWLVSSRADANRPWNWYAQRSQGGGVLGALGSHVFDYVAHFFAPVKRLSSRLSTTIPFRPDPVTGELKPVDADDVACLLLELTDGTLCQVNLSSVSLQGRGHWLEIYGDRGTLVLGSNHQTDYVYGFRLWGSQAGEPLVELPIPDRLAFPKLYPDGRLTASMRVCDRWVQAIEQGRTIAPGLREGVYSQLLIDLSWQSSDRGQWVDVPRWEELFTQ